MTPERIKETRKLFADYLRTLPTYQEGQLATRRDGEYSSIVVENWFTGFVMAIDAGAA